MLQGELENALRQIEELKVRNRELETKLQMAGARVGDKMPKKQKAEKCMVIGDSIVRNVGVDHAEIKVECFRG